MLIIAQNEKTRKTVLWHILAPSAVACDNLHLRASAHHRHVSAFLCNREFLRISNYIKNQTSCLSKMSDLIAGLEGLEPSNAGVRILCLANLAIAQCLLTKRII